MRSRGLGWRGFGGYSAAAAGETWSANKVAAYRALKYHNALPGKLM